MIQNEIIIGPPGTGKTTALLDILEQELKVGTRSQRIGFVSFTTKAAYEAADRACKRFHKSRKVDFPWFRTLHSLCLRQSFEGKQHVFEKHEKVEFGKWIGSDVTGYQSDDGSEFGQRDGDKIINLHNLARVRMEPLRQIYNEDDKGIDWTEVVRVTEGLTLFKKERAMIDYTDMFETFLAEGTGLPPLDVLLVDEAQDLSYMQWHVIAKIKKAVRRLVIAGDDDQAIFNWAGGDVSCLIRLEGKERVLDQSFRVPVRMQMLADKIISHVSLRRAKKWKPRQELGEVNHYANFSDVPLDGPDILLLVRNGYVFTTHVEPFLRYHGVFYSWRKELSVNENTLIAIMAWEKLRKGGTIPKADALKIYARMSVRTKANPEGHADYGQKQLPAFIDEDQISLSDLVARGGLHTEEKWPLALDTIGSDDREYIINMLEKNERIAGTPRIRCSTIHTAKGGEAEHVILMTEMAKRTMQEAELNPDDERRVWYVAVTRAKKILSVVDSTTRNACPWL